jgi:hypothetical protein
LRIVAKQKTTCNGVRKKNANEPKLSSFPSITCDAVMNLLYELRKVIQSNKVTIVEGDVSIGE